MFKKRYGMCRKIIPMGTSIKHSESITSEVPNFSKYDEYVKYYNSKRFESIDNKIRKDLKNVKRELDPHRFDEKKESLRRFLIKTRGYV